MTGAALLNRLKEEQLKYALKALQGPGDKSQFDFGHRVGFVAGLENAITTLLKMLDEENKRDL